MHLILIESIAGEPRANFVVIMHFLAKMGWGGGQDSALLTKPYEDSRGTCFLQHYNFCRENIHAYTCMIEQVSSWKYGKRVYLHLECK